MAARGRTAGFKMSDEHRTKIANSRILGNLIRYAEGGEENITKAQADIGIALLRKVLPDLAALQVEGPGEDGEHKLVVTWQK